MTRSDLRLRSIPAVSINVFCAVFLALVFASDVTFAADAPANLGLGLRNLVQTHQKNRSQARVEARESVVAQVDEAERLVVNIHLDGSVPAEAVAATLREIGVEILHVDTIWRKGVISARLSLDVATAAAKTPGVRSVLLAPRPQRRVGRTTAESRVVNRVVPVHTPTVFSNSGILGRGISVGIISDSYDSAPGVPRAEVAVRSGDLPGAGNPNGYTQPVVVIDDNFAPGGGQTDEGRAMAEIIHDLAPAAKLAFSTVQETQSIMAFSIRNLRANAAASCDIIVDDIYFFDEPFFSDGQLSLAVEDVVNGNTLPGKKVAYFSAAGNSGNAGYSSSLRLISREQGFHAARNPTPNRPSLRMDEVPPELYEGGFHNINATGPADVGMPLTTASDFAFLVFQWNDPFDAGAVTTDYNMLIFDGDGNYIPEFSGIDNNFATDEPLEFAIIGPDEPYYVVIALAAPAAPIAQELRFISPITDLAGPYIAYEANSMAGHATAASANAVGAYVYNQLPQRDPAYNAEGTHPPPPPYKPALEDFTSNGGELAFYFDSRGRRLAEPQYRRKPDMAAADGVNTTFFGSDYDNDGFSNFFGTSAAAPSAAAVAALMLEAAGGPGKLTPAQIRARLQDTAIPHDLDPFFSRAIVTRGSAKVEVTAHGNASAASASDPNFFTVTFAGAPGEMLNQVQIQLANADLVFDPNEASGFPFTVGRNVGAVVPVPVLSADRRTLTINFGATFQPGDSISFGIDRDFSGSQSGGNSADFLAGATVQARVNGAVTLYAAFGNQLGQGYTFADGYGMVDATRAVESIRGARTIQSGTPVNVSSRAFVGTGDEVLIGGFILRGSGGKNVIIRGIGPSLTGLGVPAALQDPVLQLFDANGTLLQTNDNWQDDPQQAGEIQQRGFAPSDPRESAIFRSVGAASFTAILRGNNNTVGNALIEVYDVDQPPQPLQLGNISSRSLVQTGDNVLIGGFIIGGGRPADVIVRAMGPSLAAAGIAGALPDPFVEVYDSQGNSVAGNDNWQQDSKQAIQIQGAGLAPDDNVESALAVRLNPGGYTAIVRGKNNTTGVGLVEVYNIP